MKTEKEVRSHLKALSLAQQQPCCCANEGHGMECRIGGMIMTAQMELLAWILGEAPGYERVVERFAAKYGSELG